MAKNDYYLKHAQHNEKVCKYLILNQDFADWVITTAFYSALQYVSYKVFPFTIKAKTADKELVFEKLDQYHNFLGSASTRSKHELLAKLAFDHCKPVAEDYKWLLDMSMNARYTNYHHLPEVAQKADTLLAKIKKHCSK